MIGQDEVEQYLASLPWSSERFENTDTWLILLRNDAGHFYLTLAVTEEWLTLTINPLIERVQAERLPRLAYHLCRLNHQMSLAHFSLDNEDDVALTIRLMQLNLDAGMLDTAVDLINQYANDFTPELRRLGQQGDAQEEEQEGEQEKDRGV